MLEAQLTKEQLSILGGYAIYKSEITGVCSFNDRLMNLLQSMGVPFQILDSEGFPVNMDGDQETIPDTSLAQTVLKVEKPLATIVRRNVIKIEHATPEVLHFCGVQSEYDPTISVRDVGQLHALLKSGVVKADQSFEQLYAPLNYRGKLQDLVCANVGLKGKGKLLDYLDGTLTFMSMKFNDRKEKITQLKCMDVEAVVPKNGDGVVQAAERGVNVYLMELKGGHRSGQGLIAHFYSVPPVLRSIFVPGAVVHLGLYRIREGKNGVLLTDDPVIFPDGLQMDEMTFVSPPNRSVPADLWRNAFFEFQMRYDTSWRTKRKKEGDVHEE